MFSKANVRHLEYTPLGGEPHNKIVSKSLPSLHPEGGNDWGWTKIIGGSAGSIDACRGCGRIFRARGVAYLQISAVSAACYSDLPGAAMNQPSARNWSIERS